jgi:cytoskeletal protein CcmA (bactofilin family)
MFKPAKNTTFNPQEINILNAGTRIIGDLASEGDLRVDGSVQGNIEVKTKLVLGQSAHVRGNINAQNSDVSGVVIGNVTVSELLTIKATAKITGDIACSKLIIEAGAEFNGNSAMRPAVVAADFRNMSNKQQKNADSKETLVAEQA